MPPMLKKIMSRASQALVEVGLEESTKKMETYLIKRDGHPYMHRFYPEGKKIGVQTRRPFGWFIHKFVGSDSPFEVHNHPWEWAFSVILCNSYLETRYKWRFSDEGKSKIILEDCQTRLLEPYMTNTIMHADMHTVQLVENKPVWTLFVHGPRVTTWGFADIKSGSYREIMVRTAERND